MRISSCVALVLGAAIIFSGIGAGTICAIYGPRYRDIEAKLYHYIAEYGRLQNGFADAQRLIRQLADRNRVIAEAARKGLELINAKYGTLGDGGNP